MLLSTFLPAVLLTAALGGFEYKVRRQTGPALVTSGVPADIRLSLQVERRGADLLVKWDQNTPAILKATEGTLGIRDGSAAEQELRLDRDQLRNRSIRYTPLNNQVQFRMEVAEASGGTVTESVLAVTAPSRTALATDRQPQVPKNLIPGSPAWYAVQVGTFRNRANAERLRNTMEARYGGSRLVCQSAASPALWRVVVGHDTTSEGAGRLAQQIRADARGASRDVLVIRETTADPL